MPEECVVRARGLPDMELASDAKTDGAGDAIVGLPIAAVGGLILFSFCRLLQNHTRTTSFSMAKVSANTVISSEVGFGFCTNAFSRATLTLVSIDVLFFRRLPIASGVVSGFEREFGLFNELSASSNHFCRRGFSLHMFLKERFNASNLEIVV